MVGIPMLSCYRVHPQHMPPYIHISNVRVDHDHKIPYRCDDTPLFGIDLLFLPYTWKPSCPDALFGNFSFVDSSLGPCNQHVIVNLTDFQSHGG